MGIELLRKRLNQSSEAIPLAIFRIVFGGIMVISQVRFLSKGWIEDLFLYPSFHFSYTGFSWIQVLPEFWMYGLLILSLFSALGIAFGLWYRLATISFFLSFTYLELIDKAWYLNHYYFVSLVAFLLIFVPANRMWSLDSLRSREGWNPFVPFWTIAILRFQLCVVYFFAGIAKLKYDWLILAEPMKTWLSARTDFPILGELFDEAWMAHAFSWGGAIYDVSIPIFLLWSKSRPYAYIAVIGFHLMTWLLFPIGMFPWIMIGGSLIFLEAQDWRKLLHYVRLPLPARPRPMLPSNSIASWKLLLISCYVSIQLCLPLRHHLYPGDVLWNEKGLRFAWHVMVMEKNGMATYYLKDLESAKEWTIYPSEYLIPAQERQMSFQPDMIHQFADHLRQLWRADGYEHLEIRVENRVCINKQCKTLEWIEDGTP
ncbi:MAG: HTTM domain-containing protein [Bacteroidota bacterium]